MDGTQWVEEISDNRCRLHVRVTISVQLQGLGPQVRAPCRAALQAERAKPDHRSRGGTLTLALTLTLTLGAIPKQNP